MSETQTIEFFDRLRPAAAAAEEQVTGFGRSLEELCGIFTGPLEDGSRAFVAYSLGNFLSAQSRADEVIGTVLDICFEKIVRSDGTVETVMTQPVFHPVINHYEANYSNIRLYLLKDYTQELAQVHGARARDPEFSRQYITDVLTQNIQAEFLGTV